MNFLDHTGMSWLLWHRSPEIDTIVHYCIWVTAGYPYNIHYSSISSNNNHIWNYKYVHDMINHTVLHTFLSSSQHLQIFHNFSAANHEALIPHWLRRGQCLTQNPEDHLGLDQWTKKSCFYGPKRWSSEDVSTIWAIYYKSATTMVTIDFIAIRNPPLQQGIFLLVILRSYPSWN